MANSTSKGAREKPAKPYKDFPLFAHATGRWAKKIKGNLHYFGPWDDPDAAILKYEEQREDLYAGRKPRVKTGGPTVMDLCNRFLAVKEVAKDGGELSIRTFHSYYRISGLILDTFGKNRPIADLRTEDFEAMRATAFKNLCLSSRRVAMQQVRTIFKFAYDNEMIVNSIRFGTAFSAPSAKSQQKDKTAKKNARRLTAAQIRSLIGAADVYMRAMIYLGINCGFGNNDCATLTFAALDLDGGWHNHARPKTGVERRAKLWPETVEALHEAIKARRKPKDRAHADLVFITQQGQPWVRWADPKNATRSSWSDSVNGLSRRLFEKLGINGGATFYSLRRMTETIGGGCRDQVAVDAVMGHSRDDMASVYRLGTIEDSRLAAVADHIHAWLFGDMEGGAT